MIANLRTVLPRCRFPMMLLVDDGCPLINPLYYERSLADRRPLDKLYFDWELKDAQVPPGTRMVKDIPLAFIEEYADWAYRNNVRGKFTVIPFPGGQGSILEGWAGGDKKEIDRWLGVVREKIAPICDIAPECITHVCALDIESGKSLPIPEWEYTAGLSVEKLTDYILFSLETLRKADLTPTGFAHPHRYKGDLRVIARAVASAMNKLNGTKLSFYWTGHTDVRSPIVRPSMMHYDRDSGQAVVGFPVACEEPMWKCITGAGNVSKMADYYISSDGASGKFVEWVKHDSYLIFYVHWEALYGNGTKKGFQTVQEIVRRANEHLGEKVLWMKTSEAARYFAASQTCEVVFSERQGKAVMIFTSPFDCPDFTVSFEINSDKKITVLCDNKAMLEAPSRKHLKENCWFREGKTIYLCLPLGQTTRVEIEGL